jgi:UDP-N-acetylmuramyl tripeptide synthase
VSVLLDHAHDPDAMRALCETASAIPAKRRCLQLGQAGDRDDDAIRELARVAWTSAPVDMVVVKELPTVLRGRALGEVPLLLTGELSRLGAPPESVVVADGELAAMRRAFEFAREGDLLVCPMHGDKPKTLAWLARLDEWGWRAGAPLPD